jgi:hypothetical protein
MKILPHIKRQIIYGFIYFIILLVIGFGIFLYTRNLAFVSCMDGEQNGAETGVDCGGSECVACEIKYAQLPEIEWVKLFLVTPVSEFEPENFYTLTIKLYNPNERIGSPEINYFYELFIDGSRKIVGSGQDQTFISPLESKMILVDFFSPEQITKARVKLARDIDWYILENPVYNALSFNEISFEYVGEQEQGFFKTEGILLNQTGVYLPSVEIIALAMDESGSILSVNRTFLDDVGVGEEDDFQIIWFDVFDGEVAEVRFEAVTNEFTLIR